MLRYALSEQATGTLRAVDGKHGKMTNWRKMRKQDEKALLLSGIFLRASMEESVFRISDTYRILQLHRAVSLPQYAAFLVGLCLQTAVNYLSKSDKYQKEPVRSHS